MQNGNKMFLTDTKINQEIRTKCDLKYSQIHQSKIIPKSMLPRMEETLKE